MGQRKTLAAVSLFFNIDKTELKRSRKTLAVFEHGGDQNMVVVEAKTIHSAVAMFPYELAMRPEELANPEVRAAAANHMWLGEKIGLEVAYWGERVEVDMGKQPEQEGQPAGNT